MYKGDYFILNDNVIKKNFSYLVVKVDLLRFLKGSSLIVRFFIIYFSLIDLFILV